MELETYGDVVKYLTSKKRTLHLLLGNGFSIAYDSKIFSYNALHGFIESINNDLLSKLFDIVKTKNFELIMQQLETFEALIDALGSDMDLKVKVKDASSALKQSLIDAVKYLHPEHVFSIPQERSNACAIFLKTFHDTDGHIFTTNYDLLLYWVLMRNQILKSVDGFGRDRESPDEYLPEDEVEYSELRWGKYRDTQNIFYLHGALPLFDTGVDIVKEEYDTQHYLLENIGERIDRGEYPIFVTAGNGHEKLTHIMHNQYLSFCYESLSNIEGSLLTFGFNFGDYDEHIIEAINVAAKHGRKAPNKLRSLYIGVYSDADQKHIERIIGKFKCKVHIFDAKTTYVWGKQ